MGAARRNVLLILGLSLVLAAGLLFAALSQRARTFVSAPAFHPGVDALLWAGAVCAAAVFGWSLRRFRREVDLEKARRRRRETRQEFLREVRDYELARTGPGGRWNN